MNDEELRGVFSRNLNNMLASSGKTQKDVAEALNILPTTFNTWCTGTALPRMGKLQLLADYFGVQKSELLEDASATSPAPELTPDEEELLKAYRLLDLMDRGKVHERITSLLENEKYSKKDGSRTRTA